MASTGYFAVPRDGNGGSTSTSRPSNSRTPSYDPAYVFSPSFSDANMELANTLHNKPRDAALARGLSIGTAEVAGDDERARLQLRFLGYRFRRSGRFRGIFWPLMGRLALDAGLWAAFIVAITFTESRRSLDKGEKYLFNAVGVGLPLMLGLNINSSFKGMAAAVRWKILASGPFTLQETDLILSLDSFLVVARLGYLWFREAIKRNHRWGNKHPSKGIYIARSLACFGWIILMFGSQAGVGLLGLTFDFDGLDTLMVEDGLVEVTNLNNFANENGDTVTDEPTIINMEQYRAHQYGDVANMTIKDLIVDKVPLEEDRESAAARKIYHLKGTNDWVYKIQDWTIDGNRTLAIGTNRIITVNTTCRIALNWEFGNSTTVPTGDWAWMADIDILSIPGDAITYVNFDVDGLQEKYHCGPRCSIVNGVARQASNIHAFTCEVAVTTVQGSNMPEHQMDDRAALLAAGSIALDGTGKRRTEGIIRYQYARYNTLTGWGATLTDANQLAQRVGKFAVGTIAMLDSYRVTTYQVPGRRVINVVAGVLLRIKTPELFIVMGVLIGTHIALIPIVLWLACSVRHVPTVDLSAYLL
ncbi:hypothetical protein BZA05DRAFT_383027 [Tricharina praecox]|uniref:uncharacterized protein n=1 Tax=Tricharina praecox TaxID=43433 RepID=UPI002220A551|nr:uncharacterized protein BZA05DRAFT_383027 [Tricharina praecox]KAI5858995.1 hypothetical protein BZA05DRAFT_383027 [Tricharina praecox]